MKLPITEMLLEELSLTEIWRNVWFSEIINKIRTIEQSPSVESLLEENVWYSECVTFSNMTTYWVSQTRKETAYGDSPLLALLALKEKLNNNNQ